jgi:hypothetical protein
VVAFWYWEKLWQLYSRTGLRGNWFLGRVLENFDRSLALDQKEDLYIWDYEDVELISEDPDFFTTLFSERPFVELFIEQIDQGDIVADFGAAEGFFSALASQSGAQYLYCFEPGETKLKENMELNGDPNFQRVKKFVGTDLVIDDYFETERDPDVVKMDIQGAELPALRSAEELIQRASPVLFLEIHEEKHIVDGSRSDIYSLLCDAGYSKTFERKRRNDLLTVWRQ